MLTLKSACYSGLSAMAIDQPFLIGPRTLSACRLTRGIQAQEIVPCASMSRLALGRALVTRKSLVGRSLLISRALGGALRCG